MQGADFRNEIDGLIAAGDAEAAARRLSQVWERESGPGLAGFVVSRYEKLRDRLPLTPYRWAVLRSFTGFPRPASVKSFDGKSAGLLHSESELNRRHPWENRACWGRY